MWFKNLKLFRLDPSWSCDIDTLETALRKWAYQPGNTTETQSLGWVAPRQDGALAYSVNGQLLLSLRTDKKLLPATVVNQLARARAQELEEQQGFKPGRKQMKDIKEQLFDELLPRAFSIYHDTRIWIDRENHWLVIDAASAGKSDDALTMLGKSLDPFPAGPLHVERSPAAAMTDWLCNDEPPSGFTIDQDTELRSTNESRAAVRYVRQSVEIAEVRKHVRAGKQCTRLALTWADRVSFLLTEGLDIKRVNALDILKADEDNGPHNESDLFDSDMTLMTAELSRLIAALVNSLGGEKAAVQATR